MTYRYLSFVALMVAILSTLAAVAAFGTASVTPNTSMAVVNTADALLALIPDDTPGGDNEANRTATADMTDWLEIDLSLGFGGASFGYQPASQYSHDKVFRVKNNDANPKFLTVDVQELDPLSGVTMQVIATSSDGAADVLLLDTDPMGSPPDSVLIPPDDFVWITFVVTVTRDAMPMPYFPIMTFHASPS